MTKFKATLVKGETYYLGNKRFERNVPQTVDEEEKAKLEANAVDRGTLTHGDGEKEVVIQQKFKFVETKEGKTTKDRAKELDELAGNGGVEFEDDETDEDEDGDIADVEADKNATKKGGRKR